MCMKHIIHYSHLLCKLVLHSSLLAALVANFFCKLASYMFRQKVIKIKCLKNSQIFTKALFLMLGHIYIMQLNSPFTLMYVYVCSYTHKWHHNITSLVSYYWLVLIDINGGIISLNSIKCSRIVVLSIIWQLTTVAVILGIFQHIVFIKPNKKKSFGYIDIIINCDRNNNIHAGWIVIQKRNMCSPINFNS